MFLNIFILILSIETITEGYKDSDYHGMPPWPKNPPPKVQKNPGPPEGCIRPPEGPGGLKRMRWLPCSLDFCCCKINQMISKQFIALFLITIHCFPPSNDDLFQNLHF